MNNTTAMLLICLMIAGCRKTNQTIIQDVVPGNAVELATGNFENGAHPTAGMASVVQSGPNQLLVLKDFSTDSGPDLKVYLATQKDARVFIQVGNLKSTRGTQTYSLTGMPDLKSYKHVLIWCQQFGILFGAAEIQ